MNPSRRSLLVGAALVGSGGLALTAGMARAADRKVLSWLRDHARRGGGLGAICTGAYTLARAGLLGDDTPAVHWENRPAFRELFDVEPLHQIYVIGRKHFSCAGGEAGVDLMLALITQDHGQKLADAVAEMCLHSRRREANATQKKVYPAPMQARNPAVARVIGPRCRPETPPWRG